MTGYQYQSRTIQTYSDEQDLDVLSEELIGALSESPVIQNVMITLQQPGEDDTAYAIDITGTVSADIHSRFSGVTAFATAEEAWLDALEQVGLERTCIRSRMDVR